MNWTIIDTCIAQKSLLKHPFYQAWSAGKLSLDHLRDYAKQYYSLESTFPRLLSRIHSNCTDPNLRTFILENLNDEEGGPMNHRQLWLNFAHGLGLTTEEVQQAPMHVQTKACIDQLMQLADSEPGIGLSALYAYESQLPEISKSKIDGLKSFYGITDPETLRFFEVHEQMDIWHSTQEKNMLTQLGTPMSDVQTAVEASCDALNLFLDGVCEENNILC